MPWRNHTKDSLQQLYDHGFALADLLEQINCCDDIHYADTAAYFSSICLDIMEQVEDWYSRVWGTFDEQTILLMGGLFEATNMVYYWWFKLALNEVLLALYLRSSMVLDPSSTTLSASAQDVANASLRRNNIKLASDIVYAAPFFSADNTGWIGPQRMVFPLKRAMLELGKAQSPVFAEAKDVFMRLVKRLRAYCA